MDGNGRARFCGAPACRLPSVDDNWNGAIFNSGATVFAAQSLPGAAPGQLSCGESAASPNGQAPGSCLNPAAFIDSASPTFTGYHAIPIAASRNQYRGPHFVDFDMALYKTFKFGERVNFGVGAQAFNVFNHPELLPARHRVWRSELRTDQQHDRCSDESLWKLPGIRFVTARCAAVNEDRVLTFTFV